MSEDISESLEEPPPPAYLDDLVRRTRPVIRTDQTPEDHEGTLYFVAKRDPYSESFSARPQIEEEAENLRHLDDLHFFHKYEREGAFMPKLYEIVRSVPARYKEKNLAVEVVIERSKIVRINGHYRATARIYEITDEDGSTEKIL